jgi:uroporphyrinogen-III synthase
LEEINIGVCYALAAQRAIRTASGASAWLNTCMKSKVVAILETRTGAHLGELIARRGGVPMLAPALEEVPDVDDRAVASLLERWRIDPFKVVIFQTGVGTRALFQATDAAGSTEELLQHLQSSIVVVRGPKPVGELNARAVRVDIRAATPFTSETVAAALSATPLQGARVLVQRYGAANRTLRAELEGRGAAVEEIATYRWAIPADTRPLDELLQALARSGVDAVVFTSAVQIYNLYAVARRTGRDLQLAEQLNRLIVGSIGPVCSRALEEHGITASFEASPPKLGPLVTALDKALSAQG